MPAVRRPQVKPPPVSQTADTKERRNERVEKEGCQMPDLGAFSRLAKSAPIPL